MSLLSLQQIAEYGDASEKTITCLCCGGKFQHLTRDHLRKHDLDRHSYREKFGLPTKFPLCSKASSKRKATKSIAKLLELLAARGEFYNKQKAILSKSATCRNLADKGLQSRRDPKRDAQIVSLWKAGTPKPVIAELFAISTTRVSQLTFGISRETQ